MASVKEPLVIMFPWDLLPADVALLKEQAEREHPDRELLYVTFHRPFPFFEQAVFSAQ